MNRLTKLVTSAAVCAAMTAVACVPAFAANTKYSFNDISDSQYSWCAAQIQKMYEEGYITGYEDNTYRPDNEVTRQECLSLFARAMGSSSKLNAEILKLAKEQYGETVDSYGLKWGQDDIAYLMYRGALKKTDLDTYLKDDEKSKPMKRYEAAIIITKAMGGDKTAAAAGNVKLDYADADTIPQAAAGYVKYASDAEILKGMDGNKFSPLTSVSRSQIAVMLQRVIDAADYSFVTAKLVAVDTEAKTCTIKRDGAEAEKVSYDDNTVMNSVGVQMIPSNLTVGMSAVFTYSGKKLIYVDTLSEVPDETITGKFMGYSSSNGVITIAVIPAGQSTQVNYKCAENVSITYDGSSATIRSFNKNDSIELNLVNGEVNAITGLQKTTTVQGAVVKDISIEPTLTMTISHADSEYDNQTYPISSKVSVKKNSLDSDLSSIYAGDAVTLTIEYGEIIKVSATSKTTKVSGIIKSLTISAQPSMTVSINGTEKDYEIPNDVKITINGSEGTLYDFRVGDSVTLTVESQAITAISASSTQTTSGAVTGVVKAINASYGFITVQGDGDTGTTTVFCKENSTKFIGVDGSTMKMSNVKEGDTVDVRGTISNGAFVGALVIVTPAK